MEEFDGDIRDQHEPEHRKTLQAVKPGAMGFHRGIHSAKCSVNGKKDDEKEGIICRQSAFA